MRHLLYAWIFLLQSYGLLYLIVPWLHSLIKRAENILITHYITIIHYRQHLLYGSFYCSLMVCCTWLHSLIKRAENILITQYINNTLHYNINTLQAALTVWIFLLQSYGLLYSIVPWLHSLIKRAENILITQHINYTLLYNNTSQAAITVRIFLQPSYVVLDCSLILVMDKEGWKYNNNTIY